MSRSTTSIFGSELPLVAAPMAGGVSTPALVQAATRAGAFAFLPAGYRDPQAFWTQLEELTTSGIGFGVNLFVPSRQPSVDPETFRRYANELQTDAQRHGLDIRDAEPLDDDDHWTEKVALLMAHPVPWVSFTFGLPSAAEAAALRKAGSRLLATVTTVDEAKAAAELGVDALLAQGSAAGGHSATFDPQRTISVVDTGELASAVGATTRLPVVAAGGVDGRRRVAALLGGGASAVAVGTLLLRSDEAGTSTTHREALTDPRFTTTAITKAFTGRPARGLANAFIADHEATAPFGYPAVHHLTRELRAKAAAAGDADRVHLWAGTGFRSAAAKPAAAILRELASAL